MPRAKKTDTKSESTEKENVKEASVPETNPEPSSLKLDSEVIKPEDNSQLNNDLKDMSDAEQVVVFNLANEEYAVPILDVQEIIPTGEITSFPNVASYIEGIINVRGTVATVINLAKKFNLDRDNKPGKVKESKKDNKETPDANLESDKNQSGQDQYIILTNINKSMFGMMVDEVTEVTKIAQSDIKQATGMMETKVQNEYISKVAVVGERVILILDFEKIVDEGDLAAAAKAE